MDEIIEGLGLVTLDPRRNLTPEGLIRGVGNVQQREILNKIFSGLQTHKIYLNGWEETLKEVKIDIFGGLRRGGMRERYKVVIDKDSRTMECSCKDFMYRARRLGIVCKHISFIVCKVIGLGGDTLGFFEGHTLSEASLERCVRMLGDPLMRDSFIIGGEFKRSKREFDRTDVCPICYDEYGEQTVLSCPDCGNYVHGDCVMVWLERKSSCVYCRSESWSKLVYFR